MTYILITSRPLPYITDTNLSSTSRVVFLTLTTAYLRKRAMVEYGLSLRFLLYEPNLYIDRVSKARRSSIIKYTPHCG